MKPILNETKSWFVIGKEYIYLDEDDDYGERVIIKSMYPCMEFHCRYKGPTLEGLCEGIKCEDEEDRIWCGIPEDFEEE